MYTKIKLEGPESFLHHLLAYVFQDELCPIPSGLSLLSGPRSTTSTLSCGGTWDQQHQVCSVTTHYHMWENTCWHNLTRDDWLGTLLYGSLGGYYQWSPQGLPIVCKVERWWCSRKNRWYTYKQNLPILEKFHLQRALGWQVAAGHRHWGRAGIGS